MLQRNRHVDYGTVLRRWLICRSQKPFLNFFVATIIVFNRVNEAHGKLIQVFAASLLRSRESDYDADRSGTVG